MSDSIVKVGHSVLQHGTHNDRIYLMKLHGDDLESVWRYMDDLLRNNDYSKVFAKVRGRFERAFVDRGFRVEASIPGFYDGRETGLFLGKYLRPERECQDASTMQEIEKNLSLAGRKPRADDISVPEGFVMRVLEETDTPALAELYKVVFATYPFPIHDQRYLARTMRENIVYFGVFQGTRLVAASSAEMDQEASNVEMTDFATHPDFTSRGLALALLDRMEREMTRRGIRTFYTIARAMSPGMNITFARMGYTFCGTLVNNTNIFDRMESMNVWYKPGANGRE